MPVGPYDTFAECVAAIMKKEGVSEESARKICGKIEKDSSKAHACGDCAAREALACGKVTYQAKGPCAILEAHLDLAISPVAPQEAASEDGIVAVDIIGPLTHHFSFGLDSYEAILCRVKAACLTPAKHVVLRIDSPGGDVYGAFETARAIRAACDAAGKVLCSYVSGSGASAAYGLACAADRIYANSSACLGSIGVIDTMVSMARRDAAMGVDTATITSGERKADGNPSVPLSEAAIAAHQAHVDELAGVFFDWVAERRGLSRETVAGFQAAVFIGAKAVQAGLADVVTDFHALREILKSGTVDATARNVPEAIQMKKTFAQVQAMIASALAGGPQASKYTDAIAALAALAEEGDEDAKKAIKKMMSPAKAEDDKGEPAPDSEPGKDKKAQDEETARKAQEEESRKAQAAATAIGTELAALRAEVAALKAAPPPAPAAFVPPPAAPAPTQGAPTNQLPAPEAAQLRAQMGLAPRATATVTALGDDLVVFGGTPEQIATLKAEKGIS